MRADGRPSEAVATMIKARAVASMDAGLVTGHEVEKAISNASSVLDYIALKLQKVFLTMNMRTPTINRSGSQSKKPLRSS